MDNISALSVMIAAPQGRAGPGIWEQSSDEGFIDFETALMSCGTSPAARVGPEKNAEPPPVMWTAPRLSVAVTVNPAVSTDMDVESVVPPQLVDGQEDLLQLIALLLGEEENDDFLCALEHYIQKKPTLLTFFECFLIRDGAESKLPDLLALLPVFTRELPKEDELPPELTPLIHLFTIFAPVPVPVPTEESIPPIEANEIAAADANGPVPAEQPALEQNAEQAKESAVPTEPKAEPKAQPVSAPAPRTETPLRTETVPLQAKTAPETAQTETTETETVRPDSPEVTAPETARGNGNTPAPVRELPDSVRVTELRIAPPRRVTYTNPFSAVRVAAQVPVHQPPSVPGQPAEPVPAAESPAVWDLTDTAKPAAVFEAPETVTPESMKPETAKPEVISEDRPVAIKPDEGITEIKPVTIPPGQTPSLRSGPPKTSAPTNEVPPDESPPSPQGSVPRNGIPRKESVQPPAPQIQTQKAPVPRTEAPPAETLTTEAPPAETPKLETPQTERPKFETPQAEVPAVPPAPVPRVTDTQQPVRTAEAPPARQVLAARIIDQITVQAAKPRDVSVLQMELHPKFLGKIQLVIEATGQGMTARLKSDNETVRSLLGENLAELKASLKDAGISMKDIEITETRVNTQLSDRRPRQDNAEEAGDRSRSGRISRLAAVTAADETESAGPVTAAYNIGRVSGDSRFDYRA